MNIYHQKWFLLFFKVFSSIYTLKPLVEALFPLWLRHLQNMIVERLHSIFWQRKSLSIYFSMADGCTADDPSIRRFGHSKRCWFEPMRVCSHCQVDQWFVFSCWFFKFPEDLRQTNCGVPLRLNVLRCLIGRVTWPVLPKKQTTIFFKVLLLRTSFVRFGLYFCTMQSNPALIFFQLFRIFSNSDIKGQNTPYLGTVQQISTFVGF